MSYHLPKGKFILHDITATVIQIKFHQYTMTHILMTIMNTISKRSVVLPYLKPDNMVKQYIQYDYDMIQSLTPDCSRFLVFHFNTSQALLCVLSVMYNYNFSLLHRNKILSSVFTMKFVDMANVSYLLQNLRRLLSGVRARKLKFGQKSGNNTLEMYQHESSHTTCYTCT